MQVLKTVLAGSFIAAALPVFAAETTQTLTDAQRDEVRALVKEVMADADHRATLADGATAGIDDTGKVFLKSEDGKYLMNIGGKVQFRYLWNDQAPGHEGFDMRRVNLEFTGYVGDPRVSYAVQLETRLPDTAGNAIGVAQAYGEYQATDEVTIRAGKFYLPYSREQLISSSNQVAVERSAANQYFTLNRAEGLQVQWTDNNALRLRGAVSDGGNSETTPAYTDGTNFAGVGRADFLVAGTDGVGFNDFNDNFAWSEGNKQGLLLGAAGYYQEPSTTAGTVVNNNIGATADATFKIANLSFYGAGFYATDNVGSHKYETNTWGAEGQVDVALNKQIDVYAQYSFINDGTSAGGSGSGVNTLQEVVLGANYKLNSHVKLTGDVVWVFNGGLTQTVYSPVPGVASGPAAALGAGAGLGTPANPNNDQVAVRLQAQVSF